MKLTLIDLLLESQVSLSVQGQAEGRTVLILLSSASDQHVRAPVGDESLPGGGGGGDGRGGELRESENELKYGGNAKPRRVYAFCIHS